jgi:hypothetical protein
MRQHKTGQAELDVFTGQFKLCVEKQVILSNPDGELDRIPVRMSEQKSENIEVQLLAASSSLQEDSDDISLRDSEILQMIEQSDSDRDHNEEEEEKYHAPSPLPLQPQEVQAVHTEVRVFGTQDGLTKRRKVDLRAEESDDSIEGGFK